MQTAIIVERVETERRKLQRASAVLLALVYSSDRGLESEQAADVVSVALDLVEQAVDALDVVTLTQGNSAR
jgi:hypothetical protein